MQVSLNNNMDSQATFQVVYDGDAVEQGEMDVRDLAPALLSLGWLIEEANRRANGNDQPVAVKFKAVEKGSLVVNLLLDVPFWQSLTSLFTGPEASALNQLLAILTGAGGVGTGIFVAIKQLRKKPIESITNGPGNTVYITIQGDVNVIQMNRTVFEMSQDPKVRVEAAKVIRPIEKPGVDMFYLTTDKQVPPPELVITKEDLPAFASDASLEPAENLSTVLLQLVNPDLTDANTKWRFTDGNSKFNASIGDADFLAAVHERKVLFGHNDAIRAELVQRQTFKGGQLRTEYEIRKVLQYFSGGIPPTQHRLEI